MREKVIKEVLDKKIIVIVRGVNKNDIIPVADALYNGGIRLMEVTFTAGTNPDEDEATEKIEMLTQHFGDKMMIGAGTVLTPHQVELTKRAGGQFVISPDVNGEVIEKTRSLDMVSIPGALTPTEIQAAHGFGADFVKLFPVGTFGSEYVKQVKAPLSNIRLLAVGGIGEANIAEYKAVGIEGFGIGGSIVNKELIRCGEFDKITQIAKHYVELVK